MMTMEQLVGQFADLLKENIDLKEKIRELERQYINLKEEHDNLERQTTGGRH